MNANRICILVLMAFIMFFMLSCPGLHDSKKMAVALIHFRDSPNESTKRELDEARLSQKHEILKIEAFFTIPLAALGYLFYKSKRISN